MTSCRNKKPVLQRGRGKQAKKKPTNVIKMIIFMSYFCSYVTVAGIEVLLNSVRPQDTDQNLLTSKLLVFLFENSNVIEIGKFAYNVTE